MGPALVDGGEQPAEQVGAFLLTVPVPGDDPAHLGVDDGGGLLDARPAGVGTQSGSSAPIPANSLPISIWATSIARPIASESAGVSTPKIVRTAICCVSADISRLTSTR